LRDTEDVDERFLSHTKGSGCGLKIGGSLAGFAEGFPQSIFGHVQLFSSGSQVDMRPTTLSTLTALRSLSTLAALCPLSLPLTLIPKGSSPTGSALRDAEGFDESLLSHAEGGGCGLKVGGTLAGFAEGFSQSIFGQVQLFSGGSQVDLRPAALSTLTALRSLPLSLTLPPKRIVSTQPALRSLLLAVGLCLLAILIGESCSIGQPIALI
jgi:hypothetical protein